MTPIRRFGAVDFVLFLYVVLLAAGVRAGYLMLTCANGRAAGPLVVQDPGDETDLRALAHSVRDSNSFASAAPLSSGPEQTAHASPGYPWLLGLLGRVVPDDDRLNMILRWTQCGLGGLTAGLYFLFARRAFRSLAVAVLAGMFCALNPFWVVNTAQIDDGVLVSFVVALTLFTGARAGQTGGPFASLLYGLSLAGSALVRAALLPFAFLGLAWFLIRTRGLAGGWLGALLGFLGFVIGVAPWTVRNWQVFGEPVPIVDSAYVHVWIGNNPETTGGPVPAAAGIPAGQAQEIAADAKQPERYARFGRLVWDETRRDPAAVPRHRTQAALAFFFGAPIPGGGPHWDLVAPTGAPGEAVFASWEVAFRWSLLAMIGLALLGWRWSFGWRYESLPAALAMVWIPLPYILSHADGLSSSRLPLDGVMLCLAAFALLCIVPGIRRPLLDGAGAVPPPPR
jgi:hypothetical protein